MSRRQLGYIIPWVGSPAVDARALVTIVERELAILCATQARGEIRDGGQGSSDG